MDLKELIAKLKKIDIEDLKKIDYKKIPGDLRKRPNIVVCIVAIGIALIVFSKLNKSRQKKLAVFRRETSTLEKKVETIKAYHSVQKKMTAFLNNTPKNITGDDLINQIADFAEARHVQIKSFSPAKKQNKSLYDLISVRLNVSTKEYKDIWLFIHDIEKSPLSIRIDQWSGRRQDRSQKAKDEFLINVNLKIASIHFKHE